MRAAYGENIRGFLPNSLRVRQVIDFGDLPLFNVAAYPAVLIGEKADFADVDACTQVADLVYPIRRRLAKDELPANLEHVRLVLQELPQILEESAVRDYPQILLRKDGWILEEPALVRLFDRLMSEGTPMGQYVGGRTYRGVLTGLTEAFVVDQAKRDELVAADPRSAELLKPWLRGRDIRRWNADWSGLYVITVQNSGDADARNAWGNANSEAEARRIFENTYPALHQHLSLFENDWTDFRGKRRTGLRPRADQGRWWWELRACTYYHEFDRPKIYWPEFPKHVRFCWAEPGALANNKCYLWADAPVWALAILNSLVTEFLLFNMTTRMGGGYLQLYDHFVSRLPIKAPAGDNLGSLEESVKRLVEQPKDKSIEEEVALMVRELYAIDYQESQLIDRWWERRSFGNEPEPDEDGDA
jgi:adenine-specific DNA-methyltransferase